MIKITSKSVKFFNSLQRNNFFNLVFARERFYLTNDLVSKKENVRIKDSFRCLPEF